MTLEKVCIELHRQWDGSYSLNNDHRHSDVDQYFRDLAIHQEISCGKVDMNRMKSLSDIIKKEIIPLHDEYHRKTHDLSAKVKERNKWKYIGWTVGIAEGVEFLGSLPFIPFGSLYPPFLIPTLLLEAGFGYFLYKCATKADRMGLEAAKDDFFARIKGISEKHLLENKYEDYLHEKAKILPDSEVYDLLRRYEFPSEFWADYRVARGENPKDEEQLHKLSLPKFERFLREHARADYSDEKREYRFDTLFLKAHEYFQKSDKDYVLKNLDIMQ